MENESVYLVLPKRNSGAEDEEVVVILCKRGLVEVRVTLVGDSIR